MGLRWEETFIQEKKRKKELSYDKNDDTGRKERAKLKIDGSGGEKSTLPPSTAKRVSGTRP